MHSTYTVLTVMLKDKSAVCIVVTFDVFASIYNGKPVVFSSKTISKANILRKNALSKIVFFSESSLSIFGEDGNCNVCLGTSFLLICAHQI